MKICMILMKDITHDARVTKEARTLSEGGHKVVVIALKSKETSEYEKRYNFEVYRIKVHTRYLLPKGQIFFFIKYLEFIFQIVRKFRNIRFDAYHAHDLETLPIGFILARLKDKPLIYDSHELYIDWETHHPMARWIWYHVEKLLASRTYITIMETESRGRVFSKRYGVSLPLVIMNCQYLNLQKKSNIIRESLPISAEEKIIIYQGKIAPSRGIDVLLESMKYLQGMVLVLIGFGVYKETLSKKLQDHKNKEKIFILDEVPWEELATYTASADIGVFSLQNDCLQYYYALSNKLFEYLSAGLPVVFSDFPEMRKVIVENNVGLVVDETDPKAVAKAIHYIMDNPSIYSEMSQNAKRIVKEKYNWEIEGKKLLNVYAALNQKNSSSF